jgi:hypothetical protein
LALTSYDATLLALSSAFGGAIVSGLFTLAGIELSRRHEARREKERADREDRREHERTERSSRDKLDDLRRVECVRLITSVERLVAETEPAVLASAASDFEDAESILELLGPEHLSRASRELAAATRQFYNSGKNMERLPAYTQALAEFYRVAKQSLGYGQV